MSNYVENYLARQYVRMWILYAWLLIRYIRLLVKHKEIDIEVGMLMLDEYFESMSLVENIIQTTNCDEKNE